MPRTAKIDPEVEALTQSAVTSIVRFHMLNKHVSFRDLAQKLSEAGIDANERNVRVKVARGEMQASFFLMCLKVLDCETISLEEVPKPRESVGLKSEVSSPKTRSPARSSVG